jgi:YD repeat-containing protein
MSRVRSVSNPYCSTSDTTYGSTLYLYDALGRKTQTTLPDGAVSAITYAGNATEVTDPFNGTTYVQHIQQVDGLGRLTNVCELSSSPLGSSSPTSCGLAIGGTGYLTTYTYDAQGNMLNVNQHGLSRAFSYDALSRLTQSLNPEVGLNVYTYPSASNPCASSAAVPCTRTDGRGVTTSYTYDALNRVLSKAYSDVATATSCYQYDSASVANGIGRLASAWTQRASAGACSMSAVFLTKRSNIVYDAMGRILSEQQCTPSNCTSGAPYAPIYTYNLAGNLTSYTNGISTTSSVGTLVFTNTYDAADHLQTVTSNWSDGTHPATLFSAQTATTTACPDSMSYPYAAFGGLMNATYGSGITLNRTYDKRLRTTCEIDTGNGTTATRGSATATITGAEQTN